MFYRRRVLLAVLQRFGGSLSATDLQKLLFLISQHLDAGKYEFFPYRYGCHSMVAARDVDVCAAAGILVRSGCISIGWDSDYHAQLRELDGSALSHVHARVGQARGRDLKRLIYLQYPWYASRSKIAKNVLSPQELAKAGRDWIVPTGDCLMTIGYEGASIDGYLDTLMRANVKAVIDVRHNPQSMKYGFSRSTLSAALARVGIKYVHLPDLGIPSAARRGTEEPWLRKKLLDEYAATLLPARTAAIERLLGLAEKWKRIALTCFEADSTMCHRHKITDALGVQSKNLPPVEHLIGGVKRTSETRPRVPA